MSVSKIDDAIRYDVYGALGLLQVAPKSETVKAYFFGKRGIPVDPPGQNTPSWLLAAEMRFEGASRYFFHPLFNLLIGPVQSSGKAQMKTMMYPKSWILDAERRGDRKFVDDSTAANAAIINRERIRRKSGHQVDSLKWIHICMFGLEPDARDVLMIRPGLAGTWRRSYYPIEKELAELEKLGDLEGLTGALALFLEAAEIGDFRRQQSAKQSVIKLMPVLVTTPALRKVGKLLQLQVENQLENRDFRRYGPIDLTLSPYPIAWQGLVLHSIYQKKF